LEPSFYSAERRIEHFDFASRAPFNPSFPRKNVQAIDIFSPGGEYLYKAVPELGEGCTLTGFS
jgi:hypothetical protein